MAERKIKLNQCQSKCKYTQNMVNKTHVEMGQ